MRTPDLITRVDELLAMGTDVLKSRTVSGGGRYTTEHVKESAMTGFRSAALSFIDRIYGQTSPHFQQFSEKAAHASPSSCETGMAILRAIRTELAGGWLFTLKSLVTAEVFADFISMAQHLLETGYKDPAAVVVGSVLEGHLHQLCAKHQISTDELKDSRPVPIKADRLNAELVKVNAYSKLDQQLVTAWLALRNRAAHGKYDEYTKEQVEHMSLGVAEFIARVAV